ncbi:MAG: terpene cyclase/mutase family protein [Planctomycetaceae bacterium]|nr:terpene cyclase/mutase family protein [Planctomycetaceae bacterium]
MSSEPPSDELLPDPDNGQAWWGNFLGSWAISLSLHAAILLVLALIILPIRPEDGTKFIVIRTEATRNPTLEPVDNLEVTPEDLTKGDLNDLASLAIPTKLISPEPSAVEVDVDQQELQWQIEAREFLGQSHALGDLAGRTKQARTMLARAYGGSAATEAAVNNGLEWLKRHQRDDGSWSFDHRVDSCDCGNPGNLGRATVAGTAMAMLCFIGAGHTHQEGDYQPEMRKALSFLKQEAVKAKEPGDLRQLPSGNFRMYGQGLVTIVLCELYGLTRDREVGATAQACLNFIVSAQHPQNGGWRYGFQDEEGDTSVVGWQVMALTSGRMARLSVPSRSRDLVRRFLQDVQLEQGAYYGYVKPEKKASTTAIGLLCRMYLGWGPEKEQLHKGVEYLSGIGPSPNNMYHNYYATQVLHHWGGELWEKWNRQMREQLLSTQDQSGHAAGSWAPRDPHAGAGGRLYMTTLAILTLEVYYRHLPLYQRRSTNNDF